MNAWDAVAGPAKAAVSEFLGNLKSAKRTFIPQAGSVAWFRDEAINAYNERNDLGFDRALTKLFDMVEKCPRCEGNGKYNSIKCEICNGTGLMRDAVKTPATKTVEELAEMPKCSHCGKRVPHLVGDKCFFCSAPPV